MTDLNVSTIFTTNQSTITGGVARGSEVVAFSETLNLLFVLGASGVDAVNPATGAVVYTISKADLGLDPALLGTGNSVAVSTVGGVTKLAVCFDGAPVVLASGSVPSNGAVGVFTVTGTGKTLDYPAIRPTESAATGTLSFAVPDQLVFTPDGSKLLVAIEGEPSTDYRDDPLGGIAIIDVATGALQIAGFSAFDAATLRAAGVRVFGSAPTDVDGDGDADSSAAPFTSTAAADLEPEYITISADGLTAYVTLQEANAIATLDIATATVTRITPLGFKDYNQAGSAIDAHDQDGLYSTFLRPALGMYQPDGIASFAANGKTYLVTANEGDAREYGSFVEEQRVSGGGLDTTVFPNASTLAANATNALGRLNVSRFTSNTDADAQFESIQSFGARSFSIWEVGATGAITQVFDSGSALDAIIARNFPTLYDDGRADNKGAEPESIALGTIGGELHAFVALERYNSVMVFEINTTGTTPEASYVTTISTPGNVAPELLTYVSDAGGTSGRLFVANETSTTTTAYQVTAAAPAANFTLQILHASDFEAGLQAIDRAPKFAAIIDALEDTQPNSITLSSGDNYIPSPFLSAQGDPVLSAALRSFYEQLFGISLPNLATDLARYDIAILNAIGVQASVFGNHEFDLGTRTVQLATDFIANAATASLTGAARVTAIGALFPYLSANLDFSADADLNALFTEALRDAASYATTAADFATDAAITAENIDRQIAPWTVINEGGEQIGVLGLTTQILASISSIGAVRLKDPAADGGVDNVDELAAILQPYIDQMTVQGIDKIILLSHLQQFQLEFALAPKLSGVDVIIAGGSHAVFADSQDGLGSTAVQNYPVFFTGTDGNAVAVVNTGSEYFDVGRLVVTFDPNGNIIPSSVDPNVSGAFVANDATVASLYGTANPYADGTRGGEVLQLVTAVDGVIDAKLAVVAGFSDVYLQGQRSFVRSQETNFGNLSVDANIFKAKQTDPNVVIGIKNGGGIREGIGVVGTGAVPTFERPIDGKVTQLDIENALRFNNALSIVSFTAQGLTDLLENALRGATPGATPGAFPHVGGVRFSFDATRAAGDRIVSLAVVNDAGQVIDTVIQNGALVGDATRTFRTVLLDFNINGPTGGDNFLGGNGGATVTFTNRQDLTSVPSGSRTYTTEGSEQDALADYLAARFATPATAFRIAETPQAQDTRIQNLAFRADTVLINPVVPVIPVPDINGTEGADALTGTGAGEIINGRGGDDSLTGGAGNDTLDGGDGIDTAFFSGTLASVQVRDLGSRVIVTGADGTDTLRNVERLTFANGTVTLNDGDTLFDTLYYLRQNPDVFASGLSAVDHFRQNGVREGRDPNAFFDTSGYLAVNADVAAAGINPLDHFRTLGAREQRDTAANFDTTLYLARNPDVAAAGLNALEHFLNFGQAEGRIAFKAIGTVTADGFDRAYYLFANPDVAAAGVDARTHFTTRGAAEGRDANVLFDTSFYLAANQDVAASGIDPLTHYALFGAREGRDPSAAFDTSAYLAANPDVAAAGFNPLTHFLQFGVYEGRAIADQSALIA